MKDHDFARAILELEEAASIIEEADFEPGHPLRGALHRVNKVTSFLRNDHHDMPELIRQCCMDGMSKKQTMETLHIGRYRFNLLADAMPDLKWPNSASILRKQYNESLKGLPVTPERRAALMRGRDTMVDRHRNHSICGVRGTVRELMALWSEYIPVSYSTINARLLKGWSTYDAFFKGQQPSAVDMCAKTRAHRKKYGAHQSATFSRNQQIVNAKSRQQEARP